MYIMSSDKKYYVLLSNHVQQLHANEKCLYYNQLYFIMRVIRAADAWKYDHRPSFILYYIIL